MAISYHFIIYHFIFYQHDEFCPPKNKKSIAPYLHEASYRTSVSLRAARRIAGLRIFMYHGVGASDCPADVFVSQMEYLSKHFQIISFQEALERLRNLDHSFDKQVVLTFDDGLRNNFTVAYPVLKKKKLPATFFVCPGLIENNSWVWAYEMGQRLRSCANWEIDHIISVIKAPIENDAGNKPAAIENIIEWMKTLWTTDRQNIEDLVRRSTNQYTPSPLEKDVFDTMTWNEIRMLSPELITIGSHTISHPILTKLPHDEMVYEISESRKQLEKELSMPIEFFCYPNGDYNEEVVASVTDCYTAAVTTNSWFVNRQDDVYKLNRIPSAESVQRLAWRMFRPGA